MEGKVLVVSFFEEVYNAHRTEYILSCYADDYIEHHPNGARSSADAVRVVQGALVIFPDLSVRVREAVQEGDRVAVRVEFTGTQRAAFAGIPATGRTIAWEAMEFFAVRDGRIVESWGAWPVHDMVRKLTAD